MAKQEITIQPGRIFYEVWSGAMKMRGSSPTKWAAERGLKIANIKPMATGATNGPRSQEIRDEMIAELGQKEFQTLYEMRLRREGLLQ